MLAKLSTISTSNLERHDLASVGSIDLEGQKITVWHHANGTVGFIGKGNKMQYTRDAEAAWLALYLRKHNLEASAKALLCCGTPATIYGAVYAQLPEHVKECYQGEDGQPRTSAFQYVYWIGFDGELITGFDKDAVIAEFGGRVSDLPLETPVPF